MCAVRCIPGLFAVRHTRGVCSKVFAVSFPKDVCSKVYSGSVCCNTYQRCVLCCEMHSFVMCCEAPLRSVQGGAFLRYTQLCTFLGSLLWDAFLRCAQHCTLKFVVMCISEVHICRDLQFPERVFNELHTGIYKYM